MFEIGAEIIPVLDAAAEEENSLEPGKVIDGLSCTGAYRTTGSAVGIVEAEGVNLARGDSSGTAACGRYPGIYIETERVSQRFLGLVIDRAANCESRRDITCIDARVTTEIEECPAGRWAGKGAKLRPIAQLEEAAGVNIGRADMNGLACAGELR